MVQLWLGPQTYSGTEHHSSADYQLPDAPRLTNQLLQTLREWLHPSKEGKLDISPNVVIYPLLVSPGQWDTS